MYPGNNKVRTQPRWYGNLKLILIIVVVIAVVVAVYFIGAKKIKESSLESQSHEFPETLFNINNVKYTVGEYENYKIIGTLYNKSSRTFKFVSVKAEFYDKSGTISGDDFTYVCGNDYLRPYETKSFSLLGDNQNNYNTVKIRVRDFTEVK